jgi:hypothetical protein
MHRHLLDAYARLLTIDTRACAALFAPDAEYRARIGSQLVELRGRAEIEAFLAHVPRQVSFRAGLCRAHGEGFRGTVDVRFPDLGTGRHAVAFEVDGGLFRRFEVRPSRVGAAAPNGLVA